MKCRLDVHRHLLLGPAKTVKAVGRVATHRMVRSARKPAVRRPMAQLRACVMRHTASKRETTRAQVARVVRWSP